MLSYCLKFKDAGLIIKFSVLIMQICFCVLLQHVKMALTCLGPTNIFLAVMENIASCAHMSVMVILNVKMSLGRRGFFKINLYYDVVFPSFLQTNGLICVRNALSKQ